MIRVEPVRLGADTVISIECQLPKTTLLVIQTNTGYIMCGALDIGLLRNKLQDRGILAARAVGVRTMEQLWDGTVESCTQAAENIGIDAGMPVREAVMRMLDAERTD